MTKELTQLRALEIAVLTAVAEKYNGVTPGRLQIRQSTVLLGHDFIVTIPGASRSFFISEKEMNGPFDVLRDKVTTETLFALFILLEEEE